MSEAAQVLPLKSAVRITESARMQLAMESIARVAGFKALRAEIDDNFARTIERLRDQATREGWVG